VVEVKQSNLKISFLVWGAVSLFSFVFGGVYTEMVKGGLGISISNLLYALLGAVAVGFPFFIASLIMLYVKDWVRFRGIK